MNTGARNKDDLITWTKILAEYSLLVRRDKANGRASDLNILLVYQS